MEEVLVGSVLDQTVVWTDGQGVLWLFYFYFFGGREGENNMWVRREELIKRGSFCKAGWLLVHFRMSFVLVYSIGIVPSVPAAVNSFFFARPCFHNAHAILILCSLLSSLGMSSSSVLFCISAGRE